MIYPPVEHWNIPTAAWTASLSEMAIDGEVGNEGVALWLGAREGGTAQIQVVVALRGAGITKQPDLLIIGDSLMNAVTDIALQLSLVLVGQVHSHGPGFGIDLSPTDKRYGVFVPDYISIVAPDYAARSNTQLSECGVHVYAPARGYERLSASEVARRIVLTDDPIPSVVMAGV